MRRLLIAALLMLGLGSCATVPQDPLAPLLEADESVRFRTPAQLLHGHDMEEPAYDRAEGYAPIPAWRGELALTDRRMLFIALPAETPPTWVSIPYAAIARARPSRTPLLNYVVVWDHAQHADTFQVEASRVRELHRQMGDVLLQRQPVNDLPARHALPPD